MKPTGGAGHGCDGVKRQPGAHSNGKRVLENLFGGKRSGKKSAKDVAHERREIRKPWDALLRTP